MLFEEIDAVQTSWGLVSLRRRDDRVTGREVFEIKLDDDYLMSSQFHVVEQAMVDLALDGIAGEDWHVLVGGLGLGYTAAAALRDPRVARVTVVEALAPVIGWHERDLFPDTRGLAHDPRLEVLHADFFEVVRTGSGPHGLDALLVDIDHAPDHLLREDHADFYTATGVAAAARMLAPTGRFSLWSDRSPEDAVVALLAQELGDARAEVVEFDNPLTGGTSSSTVYLAGGTRGR